MDEMPKKGMIPCTGEGGMLAPSTCAMIMRVLIQVPETVGLANIVLSDFLQ